MKGKQRCRILKEIRKEIAKSNDIEYVVSECKHQGDCAGTCPKCEAEVRYLEKELEKRQRAGKAIVFAGITAATVTASVGCLDRSIGAEQGDLALDSQTLYTEISDGLLLPPDSESTNVIDSIELPMGQIPVSESTSVIDSMEELMGEPVLYRKRVDNISACQPDQSEKKEMPELSQLLDMDEAQILNSLAGFKKSDVLSAWGDSIADTYLENGNRFLLTEEYIEYTIDVYYNANGDIDILEIIF